MKVKWKDILVKFVGQEHRPNGQRLLCQAEHHPNGHKVQRVRYYISVFVHFLAFIGWASERNNIKDSDSAMTANANLKAVSYGKSFYLLPVFLNY